MIPSKLTLQGIYSYQKRIEIDFETLLNSKLFGIFGSVGSGKSTILEAMSYAIYGETERLNKQESRGYNMMNLKSDKLWIDFEFRAGKENKLFRITTEIERNKKRFGETKPIKKSQYIDTAAGWEPITLAQVHEEIGLSYDNFRRTIIIPQGKFQEFLQLKDKDRTKMLKEIFHLQKFELFNQVSVLNARNKEFLNHIEGQLTQLSSVNPQVLLENNSKLKDLEIQNKEKQKIINDLELKEKEQQKLKDQTTELESLKKELALLNQQKDDFAKREKSLHDFDLCTLTFKDLLQNSQKTIKNVEAVKKSISGKKSEYQKQSINLKELEKELADLDKKRDKKEESDQKVRDLEAILDIKGILEKETLLKQRIEKGKNFVLAEQNKFGQEKLKKEQLSKQLLEKREQVPTLEVISKINSWSEKHFHLKELHKNYGDEFKLLNNQYSKSGLALKKTASQIGLNDVDQLESQLKNLQSKKNKKLEELRIEREVILVNVKLQDLTLSHGTACPLCGSEEHPKPFESKFCSKDLNKIEAFIADSNNDLKKFQGVETEIKLLLAEINRLDGEVKIKATRFKKSEEDITAHKNTFVWKDLVEDETQIGAKIKNWNLLSEECKNIEVELSKIDGVIKILEDKKLKYQQGVDVLILEINGLAGEKKGLTQQVKMLNFNDYRDTNSSEITTEIEKLKNQMLKLEADFKEKETLVLKCKSQMGHLEGALKELGLAEEKLSKENIDLDIKIEKALEQSRFDSLNDIKKILETNLNSIEERKTIEKYKASVGSLENAVQQKKQQIGGKVFNVDEHKVLLVQLNSKKEELENAKSEEAKLQAEVVRIIKLVEEKKVLQKEKEEKEKRQENIKTLTQLFKGSGFVNYISSVYLKTLCNAANVRFQQLTKQALKLEMSDDNQFFVRDYLNNGQLRNVKTLSGGQMFQASLSMSLALAQQVQELSKVKQNFFFLDEGFGSLDKEALQLVFNTLKELRKENRVVGIISHVEELQQEIETYVKVSNDPDTGSELQFSWMN